MHRFTKLESGNIYYVYDVAEGNGSACTESIDPNNHQPSQPLLRQLCRRLCDAEIFQGSSYNDGKHTTHRSVLDQT